MERVLYGNKQIDVFLIGFKSVTEEYIIPLL